VPAAFAALALVFLVGELVTTRFNASHPRPDYVQYRLDADTHQANWISDTIPPDAWTEQFFELGYEKGSAALAPIYDYGREFEVIRGAAPEVNLAAPRLKTLEDTTSEGVRTLRLRLVSARGAPYVHLQIDLPGEWVEARVNGEEIEASRVPVEQRRRFALMFYNLPEEGVDVTLSVRSKDNIDATITDYSNGLPDVPGMEVESRPPEFMPAFLDFRDPTVVYRSFEL
jgi:hypothetical protein